MIEADEASRFLAEPGINSKRLATCEGKYRFQGRPIAMAVASRMARANRRRARRPIDTYRCPYCGGWHVGTPVRS